MARRPDLPPQLLRGPFTLGDAGRAGLTPDQLLGRAWIRVGPAIYCWSGWKQTPLPILELIHRRAPAGAFYSGRSAAWLHRLDFDPLHPAEVTRNDSFGTPSRGWLSIRRRYLGPDETCMVRGLPVTGPLRTVVDLARYLEPTEAVVAVDMALHARLVTVADLERYVAEHRTCHRAKQLRRVIQLADAAAESPQETRLRLVLNAPGLPRPESQGVIRDGTGNVVARVDFLYRQERLAVEYDGATHRDSIVSDARRNNALQALGIRVLKITAADLAAGSAVIVPQLRAALAA